MTLEEKIGQMLVFGWQDAAHGDALVDELAVGGVIVFPRNALSAPALRAALGGLQDRADKKGLPPLFVGVDQEGGRVNRLGPPEFTHQPPAAVIGATGHPDDARDAAAQTARELKAAGINWDFAPVLDVNNNPANPVIGDRAYGATPEFVAAMGVAAITGFQTDGGILACGKHFPGHGDTDVDSHLALPRIPHLRARLETVELVPFEAAIRAGVAALMTAHILFPALDPDLPATLSPAILTRLLRDDLGYQGLVITDCLEMKGVADGWGAAEAAVLAVLAGADLLLCCHTWETQRAIRDALLAAVRAGRLQEARLDESLRRIHSAKAFWLGSGGYTSGQKAFSTQFAGDVG